LQIRLASNASGTPHAEDACPSECHHAMLSIFESPALFRERQIPLMGNSARILIVDDSRANAEALAASLAIDGLEMHFAQSGVDAIQLLGFWQPHVFVLDIGIRNIMVSPSQECCGVCPRPAMRASSSLRLWEKPISSRPGPWLTSTTVTARKEAPRAAFEDDQWDACIAASLEQQPLDNAVTFERVTNRAPGEPARIRANLREGAIDRASRRWTAQVAFRQARSNGYSTERADCLQRGHSSSLRLPARVAWKPNLTTTQSAR